MEIIRKCPKHGSLVLNKCVKNGFIRGRQQYRCKSCLKDVHHINYLKNADKINQRMKMWRDNNKDKIREIARKYREKLLSSRKYTLAKKDLNIKSERIRRKLIYLLIEINKAERHANK